MRAISAVVLLLQSVGLAGTAYASCTPNTPVERGEIRLDSNGEFVPQWAKSAIWYQIFPERFRDGDSSNNPTVADIAGADPAIPPKQWQVHPWGSDWYKRQPYELANGEAELNTHLLRRRYGGDLQGIIDKLDYLKQMGFNAIYLNPVFDSPSLHKYDGASYHHIDPNFGPDPVGDRKLMATENPLDPATWVWTKADELALELIAKAKQRGIRIIFDGVFNHMGINSFAFVHLKQHQQASPYKDWFYVDSFADAAAGTSFSYKGWFGFQSLPELREDENGIVAGPKAYIFAATERWMNPKGKGTAYGIDGWRLDVAFCVSHKFWQDWRRHVKALNPDAYLTAEIIDSADKVQPYLQGDEFDGEMNYNFAFTAAEFLFNPPPMSITATEFDARLEQLRGLYPKGVAYVTQNLFGSHDSNRIGSHIVNRGIANFRDWGGYFKASSVSTSPLYKVRKPTADELQLQKLFVTLQMTYVGAPMVYYGDEVGMWGANDPDDRKPMIWPDIRYEDEVTNPDGSKRAPDKVVVNTDLQEHYKQLIALRHNLPALRLGSYRTLVADDAKRVFAYEREYQGQTVWVVLNASEQTQQLVLPDAAQRHWQELLSAQPLHSVQAKLPLSVAAQSALVLLAQPKL
ncbi:glycoside hydrolase family 13 protein [Rheinheimera muenzenbergensis]|uniref:Glycoside hydrolase family 13 protein n=1 Tax=Rheinheimera muenzenbergensis TaxID=1193628 RepID=A0ABU8C8N1_9GAMM